MSDAREDSTPKRTAPNDAEEKLPGHLQATVWQMIWSRPQEREIKKHGKGERGLGPCQL